MYMVRDEVTENANRYLKFLVDSSHHDLMYYMNLYVFNKMYNTDFGNRKYKDYVYRKMLVQEYLKKWRIFKRVKPKNDMMFHDIYNCICQNTKNKIHNPLCQTYSPTVV